MRGMSSLTCLPALRKFSKITISFAPFSTQILIPSGIEGFVISKNAYSNIATLLCDLNSLTNSFTSVSLDPPLILVCIDRMTATYPLMKESRIFSVNILSNVQESLSKLFSDPGNKSSMLQGLEYREEVTGAPILLGVLGFLDCSVEATYQWGDHDIFLAKVEKFGLGTEADPLLYYRGGYHSLR